MPILSGTSRRTIALAVALLLVSTPVPKARTQGDSVRVTVLIMRVIEVSCDDGDFTICPDDYYAQVNINNLGLEETNNLEYEDQADISPYWRFTRDVDSSLGTIPIEIQIWDDDDASGDDTMDISEFGNTVDLTLDLATGTWTGDVPANVGFSQGANARILFDISISGTGTGDHDRDGIPDGVERFGVRDGNGNLVADLGAMGADPCRKTVAVEIDFMEQVGVEHTHRPLPAALAEVVAAYDAAPVQAPINCPYPGFPTQPSGIQFIADVDDAIDHAPALDWGAGAEIVRDGNFDPARRPYFHYALFIHDKSVGNGSSGESNDKDVLVSLGSWTNDVGTVREQSGTLMHEIGHTLGLSHSPSGNAINCNPNYLSVMSYTFQTIGIPDPTLPDFDVDLDGDGTLDARARLDYSRAKQGMLDESQLYEPFGILGEFGGTTDLVVWSLDAGATLQIASGVAAIDWNANGTFDSETVAEDINNLGKRGCGTDGAGNSNTDPGELLFGQNDWPSLAFRAVLAVSAGASPPPAEDELDFQTAQQIKSLMAAALKADPAVSIVASPATVVTGANVTYTIAVTNSRPVQADNVVVTDTLPAGLSFVSCASTGGGVCGGSGNNRTVTFPVLAGQSSETVTLVAAVDCATADAAVVGNSVSLTSSTPDYDAGNNAASASFTASNPPPVISTPSVSASTLWPPTHAMRDITIDYTVTDNCGTPILALSVTSNEPVNGDGDGNTAPDWEIVDAHRVRLRAERAGSGSGRIYIITITATDSGGGSSTRQVQVLVPKNRN